MVKHVNNTRDQNYFRNADPSHTRTRYENGLIYLGLRKTVHNYLMSRPTEPRAIWVCWSIAPQSDEPYRTLHNFIGKLLNVPNIHTKD